VIVSVDTIKGELRIAEDRNNNGTIEGTEWKFWRPSGEGNRFAVPVAGLHNIVTTSVVGGSLKSIDNFPSVIFHRDGSTSSDAEIYIMSAYKGRVDFCAIELTRSTGRTELYRLNNAGALPVWQLGSE
jgi:hypothetical protein